MFETIKIPKERLAVLIGKEGGVKKNLEEATGTEITIRKDIEIRGEEENVFRAREVIKAIGRGFSPENAFMLLGKECRLEVISLKGESERRIKSILGRVIGRNGATRRRIEECSGAHVAVYGKTVSVLGKYPDVEKARRFIDQLLAGRPHGYVYRMMEEEI